MKQILKLILLLVIGQTALAQAPSNYVNINGRYRWIAGMFDSTFHIPKGTTPSLRTGGSTNGGALFYKTADSSLQLYTGTQWLRMLKVGDTTGMLTPYFNSVGVGLKNTGQTVYADTLLLSTRLWRNKGIDSVQANLTAGLATKLNISDTASMLSPYARTVNVRQIVSDSLGGLVRLKALNAGGAALYANSGTKVAEWGLGGSANMDFHGFAGYDINRASSYTVRSFTDKNYVDSAISASPSGTVTSVATNTGTGITGGTITTSGTIAADTLLLSTRAWRQKGVDSVAALANTKVSSVSGTSPISSSGGTSPTISISQSSGSTNGFLSSTDWTTFNNKQNALTLTTTGTSGAATLVGSTLNIPQYQAALTNPVTGTGTTNYIPKFTSSSAIGNSVIYNDATGVGVGTTSPSYTFHTISPNASIAAFRNSGASIGQILVGNTVADLQLRVLASGDALIFSDVSKYLAFGTNGATERMRLDASGNLGLGTSSPSYKLDVNGTGGFADNVIAQKGQNATTKFEAKNTTVGTSSDAAFIATSDASAGTTVFGKKSSGVTTYKILTPSVAYWYNGTAGDIAIINDFGSGAIKMSAGGSSTAQLTLDASGNLGLSVTPSAWSLGKAIDINGGPGILGVNNGTQITNNAYYNGGWIYKATSYAQNLVLDNDGSFQFRIAPSGTAGNAISFTQAMTLFSTGNLAVGGTSDNGFRLNISGRSYFDGAYSNTSDLAIVANASIPGINLRTTSSGRFSIISNYNAANTTTFLLGTGTNNPSDAIMLFDHTNSRIGIGTTSPTYKLVVSNNGALGFEVDPTSSSGGIVSLLTYDRSVGSYKPLQINSEDIRFQTGTVSTERMRITSGGLVGIGSSSPDEILRINGTNSATSRLRIQNNGTNIAFLGSYSGIVGSGNANDLLLSTGGNDNLAFGINTTEKMRITSGGELLINTTSDAGDYKLQVSGNGLFNGNLSIGNTSSSSAAAITFQNSVNGYQFGFNSTTTQRFVFINGALSEIASIDGSGNQILTGSIKTAAPSGGTAAAWKLGERVASAGVTFNDQQYIQLDIGGTLYYLATVDLPMPEAYPQATSGPSNNYKMAPVQVKTTRDVEIENLRKEIEELKQLIKNK